MKHNEIYKVQIPLPPQQKPKTQFSAFVFAAESKVHFHKRAKKKASALQGVRAFVARFPLLGITTAIPLPALNCRKSRISGFLFFNCLYDSKIFQH